jgi:hypothetical protein
VTLASRSSNWTRFSPPWAGAWDGHEVVDLGKLFGARVIATASAFTAADLTAYVALARRAGTGCIHGLLPALGLGHVRQVRYALVR